MRHRKFTFKIGRTSAHRKSMMANAVLSLIAEGRIETTVTKGKQIKRMADKMITLGKKGTLHARRQAVAKLQYNRSNTVTNPNSPQLLKKLFEELAPSFADRNGGYTRLVRTGFRRGDAAEMCFVEFVNNELAPAPAPEEAEEAAETPAEAPAEETATEE